MHRWTISGCAVAYGLLACARPAGDPPAPGPSASPAVSVIWRDVATGDAGLPQTVKTFCAAKGELQKLYQDHRETFLCGCSFGPNLTASLDRCGYVPKLSSDRAHRVEWRHIVPVEVLLAHRPCFREPLCTRPSGEKFQGIACCEQADRIYQTMVADLHGIVPELGEINDLRGARSFGELPGEAREFGRCDLEIDTKLGVVEPPASRRGDIARAYLYMHHVYRESVPLTAEEIRRFEAWHAADPPSEWERVRNRRIAEVQGSGNPLVE